METIQEAFLADLAGANDFEAIEQIRLKYLSRKGIITNLAKATDFGKLSSGEKKHFGQKLNELKQLATERVAEALRQAKASGPAGTKKSAPLDLTLPGTKRNLGALHPISLVQMEIETIFEGMGFSVMYGPEVETEHFNFEALNIPADHPARDMQDTFWLTDGQLLRTHTSACQVRAMLRYGVPLRMIFPGRCFRYESVDPSHENTFYQCEGVLVDEDISVANLIAVMKTILGEVFRREVRIRLRPGFFPFVEPGFELDLNCLLCGGKGCPTCGDGWIELIPCGLIHPNVLKAANIDSRRYSGFAFGIGLTRLAMMKYGIRDIRLLNCGDVRFYEQFAPML